MWSLFKPKLIIPLALIFAFSASYGAYVFLKKQAESIKNPKKTSQLVIVARAGMVKGTQLTIHHLQTSEWPVEIIPTGTFSDTSLLKDRVLKVDVSPGEPILESKLAPPGSIGGLSSLIPPGMRAMTVAVNIVSGVSGFILPHARVDILVTAMPSSKREEATTKIILEDVEVLAIDQTTKANDEDPVTVKSVTLLVSPDEAEKLALASSEGKLQLSLRNAADRKDTETPGIHLKELVARKSKKPVRRYYRRPAAPKEKEPEPPAPKVVEVIRSNERSEVTFEEKPEDKKEK